MLHVLEHPLITHKLAIMRSKDTSTKDFRQNLDEIAGLMAHEITRDVPTRDVVVETPMGDCHTQTLATAYRFSANSACGTCGYGPWYLRSGADGKGSTYRIVP